MIRCVTDTATPTLFDQLGGTESIDVAVEEFYRRVLDDPDLRPFFAGVPMRRLRAHQKAFMTMAFGGPQTYRGRDLGQAHAHLGIEDHHVDLVAGHLADVLNGLGVPAELVDQVMGAVERLRPILVHGFVSSRP